MNILVGLLCLIIVTFLVVFIWFMQFGERKETLGKKTYWFACKNCGKMFVGLGSDYIGMKSQCCGHALLIWRCQGCRKTPMAKKKQKSPSLPDLTSMSTVHCEFCGHTFGWVNASWYIDPCTIVKQKGIPMPLEETLSATGT